ncbi:MAG: hypothetical protein WCB73_21170 [Pseudonocardiaceae bacterium]
MREQRPLELSAQQRPQPPQVELPRPARRKRGGAPGAKCRLVGVGHWDRAPLLFVGVPPLRGQFGGAGACVAPVAVGVP